MYYGFYYDWTYIQLLQHRRLLSFKTDSNHKTYAALNLVDFEKFRANKFGFFGDILQEAIAVTVSRTAVPPAQAGYFRRKLSREYLHKERRPCVSRR